MDNVKVVTASPDHGLADLSSLLRRQNSKDVNGLADLDEKHSSSLVTSCFSHQGRNLFLKSKQDHESSSTINECEESAKFVKQMTIDEEIADLNCSKSHNTGE